MTYKRNYIIKISVIVLFIIIEVITYYSGKGDIGYYHFYDRFYLQIGKYSDSTYYPYNYMGYYFVSLSSFVALGFLIKNTYKDIKYNIIKKVELSIYILFTLSLLYFVFNLNIAAFENTTEAVKDAIELNMFLIIVFNLIVFIYMITEGIKQKNDDMVSIFALAILSIIFLVNSRNNLTVWFVAFLYLINVLIIVGLIFDSFVPSKEIVSKSEEKLWFDRL